ncbi:MAG: hypothetical protein M1829_003165 [Trizodia sp. TS-e1964]|nr:MAG: hypothetical protein M1829_003165 [Trizodia sp. TS-e1964]
MLTLKDKDTPTPTTSFQKATTQKRSREAEVEEANEHSQTKRLRKPDQRLSPVEALRNKKRRLDTPEPIHKGSPEPPQKRARQSPREVVEISADKEGAASKVGEEDRDPIRYWTKTYQWPKGYAKMSGETNHLLAKRPSSNFLRRKRSEPASIAPSSDAPSFTTPSDQKVRGSKSAPYQDLRYETLLSTKGSFMEKSPLGITKTSKQMCQNLLDAEQSVPADSLFRDDIFESTCRNIKNKNETRVVRDISLLIVPSAETLATYGAKHLDILIESTNEGWNNSLPLTGTRPQPDYSVGFRREAFTSEQLEKLAPYIGDFLTGDQCYFMGTYYLYFPFLSCEVKCGAAALDVADRQNAHSMTLAVRAIAELFRLVGRETEVNRQILAFSISHDSRAVRIYGHYPVFDGTEIKYYRHPIDQFDFTARDGKEKWTSYKFTKNVYDSWMPAHFERLCSAIDQIPADLNFSVPKVSQSFGLSQDLERYALIESQSNEPSLQSDDVGISTSNTTVTGERGPKRLKEGPIAGQ